MTTDNVSTTFGSDARFGILNVNSTTSQEIIQCLHLSWHPKEDITTFELAKCMEFLLKQNMVLPYEFDKSAEYARHWQVSDPNHYPDNKI